MSHKTYEPTTDHYGELLRACRAELITLGYGPAAVRLCGAGELLQWLEGRGRLSIMEVERADLAAFVVHLQQRPSRRGGALSAYTVDNYLYSLKLLFDYCERRGLRGGSPLAGLRRPVVPVSERYVATRAEIAALYAAATAADGCEHGRLTALLHLLYACGLRRSEVEWLEVGDVDAAEGLVYVRRGKGRRRRVVPLTEGVAAGLRHYRRRVRWCWVRDYAPATQALLLNRRGGRMRGDVVAGELRGLVVRAEVDERITPHALRHSVASHLVAGGMPLERVRDFLGHDHLETTQLYTRIKSQIK